MTATTNNQTFGYRSLIFRSVAVILAWIVFSAFFGILGFVFAFIISFYMNLDGIDTMRVTLDDELLYVTRYFSITKYECKFWLKDIEEAGIYLRVKAGKAKQPNGGKSGYIQSWYQLHVILKDGREQKVMLLGMLAFERNMLKKALEKKGIKPFEILYRLKEGGTLHP